MTSPWIKDTKLPGLYKRLCAGTDQWYVKARQSGQKPRTVKIGRCDVYSVTEARSKAKVVLAQLSEGINPNQARQAERQSAEKKAKLELARSLSLRTALEEYLSLKDYKPKTHSDMQSMFVRNFPDWLDKPIREITREDVLQRFKDIKLRVSKRRESLAKRRTKAGLDTKTYDSADGQGEAQKAFRYLQAVINSFMDDTVDGEPLLTSNPCKVLKDKKLRVVLRPRESYLDESDRLDLVDLLSRVDHPEYDGVLSKDDRDFLFILLMTGLRFDEARTLRWKNIDLEKGVFRAVDTKNKRDHTLPMTRSTKALFKSRLDSNARESEWVFPSPLGSSRPSSMSRTFERVVEESGIQFTAHDLRRTVATVASELGYDLERVSAVLNHAKIGVTAGYVQTTVESLRTTLTSIEDMVLRSFEVEDREDASKARGLTVSFKKTL